MELFAQDAKIAQDAKEENPEKLILIEEKPDSTTAQQPIVSTWDFVKMVLVLAGVVGVIYLLFLLLKRGAKAKRPENELIKLLDYQGLSGNRGLHLVGVGNNMYLVGSSENGVSLISEIKDKESLDSLRLDLSQKTLPSKKSFSELLLGIFKPSNKRVISFADSLGFMKNQKERLKKLR